MGNLIIQIIKKYWPVAVVILIAAALRIIWLYLPVHGDEGESGYNAMLWNSGNIPYSVRPLLDKPPMFYLLYLLPIKLFGNEIIPVRIFNDILFLFSLIALYFVVKAWFGRKVGLISMAVYGLFMSTPVVEGSYALASSFSISFIIFSLFFGTIYILKTSPKVYLVFAGVLASLASLTYIQRTTGILLLVILILVHYIYEYKDKNISSFDIFRKSSIDICIVMGGFIIPIIGFSIYFAIHGALGDVINGVINGTFSALPLQKTQEIPFGWDLLTFVEILPLILLSALGIIICISRLWKYDIFILSWLLIFVIEYSIVPLHFGHHIQSFIPPASIFAATGISIVFDRITKTSFRELTNISINIFIVILIIISIIPSMLFQKMQYPNFTIDWNYNFQNTISTKISWNASFGESYNQQIQLVNYLKGIKVKDGELLLLGWSPYTYWLSGIFAPTASLCTVREWNGVSEEGYQELCKNVHDLKYKYVVFPDVISTDQLSSYVQLDYHFVKRINSFNIYEQLSKSTNTSPKNDFMLISEFSSAIKEYELPDGTRKALPDNDATITPAIRTVGINGEYRTVIFQHPLISIESKITNSIITFNHIEIHEGDILTFGIGIDQNSWDKVGDGVQFKVTIRDDLGDKEVFSEYIDPKSDIQVRKWNDNEVDLRSYIGEYVDISLVTNSGPKGDVGYDWAYWSQPIIVSTK